MRTEFDFIDSGHEDLIKRILWLAAKGTKKFPRKLADKAEEQEDG